MTDDTIPAPPARPALPLVRLQPARHKRTKQGHPWAYSNEIQMDAAAKALPAGSLVRLTAHDGEALGVATFNPHTLMSARLLSRNIRATVDRDFLAECLRRALALRERLYDRPFYRLIHAEADGLPALIVDRFGDTVVVQANSAGMDRLLPDLLEAIDAVLAPAVVVLRNDSSARTLEGLNAEVRVAKGTLDGPVTLEENGSVFFADPLGGQKTGWFFDQRDNRAFIASLSAGARVIDFYSYNGGFAVQCARAGAASVIAVDSSQPALDLGARAAEANGVAGVCAFRRVDAFVEMERLEAAGERFDVVVADPPAFAKSRKDVPAAARAYCKMIRLAARLTAPGGFMLVASCSHNIELPLFTEQVARGLSDAGRAGRVLRAAGAAPDHPVHPFLPESAYLKAQVLQVD